MARGSQVSPDRYFAVALALLAEGGVGAVKIGTLCARLRVTSGSFYHHFAGWNGFVTGLLAHWEAEQTQRVLRMARARVDPWERIAVIKREVLGLPHDAEAALRAWGRAEPEVGAAQRRVDTARRDGLRELITAIGVAPDDARRLAVLGVALLAGAQQTRERVDLDELGELLDEYQLAVARYATLPTP